jgi:hypothetical protein
MMPTDTDRAFEIRTANSDHQIHPYDLSTCKIIYNISGV